MPTLSAPDATDRLDLPPAPTLAALRAFRRAVWVYDLDLHRIVAASPLAATFWRADSAEALTQRSLGPMSASVLARLANYRRAIAAGETLTEAWTLYPRGEPATVTCTCTGVRTAEGTLAMLVEAEPPSEAELDSRRLVEAFRHDPAPVLIFSLKDGQLLVANPAAEALVERRPTLETLFAEEAPVAQIRATTGLESVASGEHRLALGNGTRVAAWRAARGLDPVAGGDIVTVTLLDVTDDRALTLSRIRELHQAVEAGQDAIALTDAAGCFTYMNPAHLRMFGYETLDQVVGKPWTVLYDEVEQARFIREIFPRLTAPGDQWRFNADGRHLDGTVVHQEVALTIKEDGGILCATRDIGRRLELEAQRRQLEVELAQAQKMESVGQLVGGLAHDVNNLLLAMTATASGIAAKPTPDRVRLGCERINHAGTQANRIIRRMLDFVRRQESPPSVKDVRGVLNRSADLMAALLLRRVEFKLDLAQEPLPALIREEQLVQILLNLAANARDAMGPAGGTIRVTAGLTDAALAGPSRVGRGVVPAGEVVEIRVEDSGPGLPPEVEARLFEPYFTTKSVGHGTGLGLSTSAALIEALGGRIEAWNTGSGAAFRLLLPLAEMPPVTRVLVAHPDHGMAELVARVLDTEGFTVAAADGARAALDDLVRAPESYQLVVAEFEAPSAGGMALVTALRAAHLEVPVLLTTPERSLAACPAGCTHLRTPFTAHELLVAVRGALGRAAEG